MDAEVVGERFIGRRSLQGEVRGRELRNPPHLVSAYRASTTIAFYTFAVNIIPILSNRYDRTSHYSSSLNTHMHSQASAFI